MSLLTFGLLGGLLAITSPPEGERFQLSLDDPWAADYEPPETPLYLIGVAPVVSVSNHLVRVFGLQRPHAYGLDLQLGVSFTFEGENLSMWVRLESGYAFVHHAEFDGHASLTGIGVCLGESVNVCYTPKFVAGSEAHARSLGLRHGLAVGFALVQNSVVALEVQHGIAWVGSAGARHELRGALTVDLVELVWLFATIGAVPR